MKFTINTIRILGYLNGVNKGFFGNKKITSTILTKKLNLCQDTIFKTIEKLNDEGYVTLEKSGVQKFITITDKGTEFLETLIYTGVVDVR